MEIGELLEIFEDMEARMARLYAMFATQYRMDPRAGVLFRGLASEEVEHRDIVRFQQSMVRQGVLQGEVEVDLGEIEDIMDHAADLMSGSSTLALRDAVALAVEFESRAAETHYRTAAGTINPDVGEMMKTLGTCDTCHQQKLIDFATARGMMPDPR